MEIGNKIKQLRHKYSMTQDQLAGILSISPQSISKWETGITMPDITLLPKLAEAFGITIDELFDLSVDQKLQRIERRIDLEEEFSSDIFHEYETFLKNQLDENIDRTRILSLLAHLYHHRVTSDCAKVSKYAREAMMRNPEKKDCQWLLQKAEGAHVWDWNIGNHTGIIEFYKSVIKSDTITPKTPMPYYEVMDNLIADHRVDEARYYLGEYKKLPAHKPVLVPVYEAYIAMAEYNPKKSDRIMSEALEKFSDNSDFLFEYAQYCAKKCDYRQAIEFYEQSFAANENKKPRFTDALHGIAIIYEILGDNKQAIETYDRMIACIKDEWGYNDGDAAITEAEREKIRLQNKVIFPLN